MKVKFIGTGSGIATLKRNNCCVLLEGEAREILLDCGEPASASLLRAGIKVASRIDVLLVSHMHSDHIGGALQLVQHMQLTGRKKDFDIYLPAEGAAPLQGMLNATYLFKEELPFKLTIHPIKKGVFYKSSNVVVSACRNMHLERLGKLAKVNGYPNKGDSFSFRIEMDGKSIVYSGDLKESGELAPLLDGGVDLLISELAHVDSSELFSLLESSIARRVVMTHIHPAKELDEDAILSGSPGKIRKLLTVAHDGMTVSL